MIKGFFDKIEIHEYKLGKFPGCIHISLSTGINHLYCIGGFFPEPGTFVIVNFASFYSPTQVNQKEFARNYVGLCRKSDPKVKIVLHLEDNLGSQAEHIKYFFRGIQNVSFETYTTTFKSRQEEYDNLRDWLDQGNKLLRTDIDVTLLTNTLKHIYPFPINLQVPESDDFVLDQSIVDGLAHVVKLK
jgi:hypothetical protein